MKPVRILLAIGAIFVFAILWNGLVHMVILGEANAALEGIARPAPERSLPLSLLLTAGIALVFVASFLYCSPTRAPRDGIVHGLMFAAIGGLFVDLNQYVLYPIPGPLAASWFAFAVVEFCVYGVIASLLLKRR